ncbi:hypothetical protein GJ496_000974 [Pomphorhynchus laevis]|nr:hypothetical protein GJ496_000974 [Pomphorhynchus laevis]
MLLERIYAAQPETSRGLPCKLSTDPTKSLIIYTNGLSIFLRNVDNPLKCQIYSKHTGHVQVAKCCPQGRTLIASADNKGNVHTWEYLSEENNCQQINELHPPLITINDIVWSVDTQRIAIGGRGRERFGHVFTSDTGNSVGEIMGITRDVIAIDYRPCKPFRVVLGSDDGTVSFFNGPPFKFSKKIEVFPKAIHCMSYSPDGQHLAVGSANGGIALLNGDYGEMLFEFGKHNRSVMGVSWSPDGQNLVSVGTDGVVNIWSIAKYQNPIRSYNFNDGVENYVDYQQLGCIWLNDRIVSVSMLGHLNIFSADNLRIMKSIQGHQSSISALACFNNMIISGGQDGIITIRTDTTESTMRAHRNNIVCIAVANKWMLSCGIDDTLVFFNPHQAKIITSVSLDDQPVGCATFDSGIALVVCRNSIIKFEGTVQIAKYRIGDVILSVSISHDATELVIATNNHKVLIYLISDLEKPMRILKFEDNVNKMAHSPNGQYIAMAYDESNKVVCFRRSDYETIDNDYWNFHAAKVTSLSWCPSSQYLASTSIDSHVMIYDTKNIRITQQNRNAHDRSPVMASSWPVQDILYTGGHDSCVRKWRVTL